MPALVANALSPTYGAWRLGTRFNISSSLREAAASPFNCSSDTLISNRSENSLFNLSVGMIDTRLALPQRSPRPFSVP